MQQARIIEYDDEAGPLSDGEYEEGLDDEYDEDDEEYEEEEDLIGDEELNGQDGSGEDQGYIRGLGPLPGSGPAGLGQGLPRRQPSEQPKAWQGLERLPAATKAKYVQLLNKLHSQNKQQVTILLLGKHFVGKSLTVNSLLNEDAAARQFLNREVSPPTAHSREAHNFTLTLIDTAGVTDIDSVSTKRLEGIGECIKDRRIDIVLYVDRFDMYRTDGSDQQVIKGISSFFGSSIWDNAIVGLTYAGAKTINGYAWDEVAARRGEALQKAIRKYGSNQKAALPIAYIENSNTCQKNSDGEKVLPDGSAWLPDLMQKVTDVAASTAAYSYDPVSVEKSRNPNKKLRWLVPVLFAAQVAFKFLVFDKLIADDAITGDKHGPYAPSVVKAERARIALEKSGRDQQQRMVQRVWEYESDSD